jgi:hypothetical protein
VNRIHQDVCVRIIRPAYAAGETIAPGAIGAKPALNPILIRGRYGLPMLFILPFVTRTSVGKIRGIHIPGQEHLFLVVDAPNFLRTELGLAQSWQEHGRQNGNDGDYDQQFNQCKGPAKSCARAKQYGRVAAQLRTRYRD